MAEKPLRPPEQCACDAASIAALEKAGREGLTLSFQRLDRMGAPCGFGMSGVCCRI